MPGVSESAKLVDGVVRLRRAERIPGAAEDVRPVRRELEARLGSTLTRSRAARILGVSQTALDRWVEAGQVPVVRWTGRASRPSTGLLTARLRAREPPGRSISTRAMGLAPA
jgi:hypothetical protein